MDDSVYMPVFLGPLCVAAYVHKSATFPQVPSNKTGSCHHIITLSSRGPSCSVSRLSLFV